MKVKIIKSGGGFTSRAVTLEFHESEICTIKDVLAMVAKAAPGDTWYCQIDDGPEIRYLPAHLSIAGSTFKARIDAAIERHRERIRPGERKNGDADLTPPPP